MHQEVRIYVPKAKTVIYGTLEHALVFLPRPNDFQLNIVITKRVPSKVRLPSFSNILYFHTVFKPCNVRGWTRYEEQNNLSIAKVKDNTPHAQR